MNQTESPSESCSEAVAQESRNLLDTLAKARKRARVSQTTLALRTGMNRMTLVRMEGSEDADPQLSTVLAAAHHLGLRLALLEEGAGSRDARAADISHRGVNFNRLKRDPEWDDTRRETALAKHWEAANRSSRHGLNATPTLEHLVPGYSQDQATAAATVVQWLGSDIGFAFLQEAMSAAGYEVVRKARR